MYSDFNISSLEEVIFLLNDIVSLIKFYEKYHDGCEFISYDEIKKANISIYEEDIHE